MSSEVYAHFIGIGGVGMSGIARVLHERGIGVTGSDLKLTRYARALQDMGIPVAIGHDAANVGDPEVVVVSAAIPEQNPEVLEARRRDIPVWPRARMLARAAGDCKTVAVAGTHGKTTTSSMVTWALAGVGSDPTFLIGGELNEAGSNARSGSGPFCVVEADESDGSFLYLEPHAALVTNVEADHLDHYDDLAHIESTFRQFVGKVSSDGLLVVCADDDRLMHIADDALARLVTYGSGEDAHVRCGGLETDGLGHRFEVLLPDGVTTQVRIAVPGRHNVLNATGALALVWALGLDVQRAADALARFSGVRRRFELLGEIDGVTIVDDYAHHPTEVRATLEGARQGGFARIWAIFQPHRYTRTEALGPSFGEAFEAADRVILMDVYSAGEPPIPGVSGKTVARAVLTRRPRTSVAYFPHRIDVTSFVASRARRGDLVMTMGAGDVTEVARDLVRAFEARADERGGRR